MSVRTIQNTLSNSQPLHPPSPSQPSKAVPLDGPANLRAVRLPGDSGPVRTPAARLLLTTIFFFASQNRFSDYEKRKVRKVFSPLPLFFSLNISTVTFEETSSSNLLSQRGKQRLPLTYITSPQSTQPWWLGGCPHFIDEKTEAWRN